MKKKSHKAIVRRPSAEYSGLIGGIAELLEAARRSAARTVNALMTATYWEIGRRIVEFEQAGSDRAGYGKKLLAQLSEDLSCSIWARLFGRQSGDNAPLLRGLPSVRDFRDSVSEIFRAEIRDVVA